MTDAEVKKYFEDHAIRSWNGVLDDTIFGAGEEWYVIDYIPHKGIYRQPEPYSGPYKSYDEALEHESLKDLSKRNLPTKGHIYTK